MPHPPTQSGYVSYKFDQKSCCGNPPLLCSGGTPDGGIDMGWPCLLPQRHKKSHLQKHRQKKRTPAPSQGAVLSVDSKFLGQEQVRRELDRMAELPESEFLEVHHELAPITERTECTEAASPVQSPVCAEQTGSKCLPNPDVYGLDGLVKGHGSQGGAAVAAVAVAAAAAAA
eukprot:CAMPEP_0172668196 /NCGR_PEP_ID=MMETSP1074-20121228/8910_1 /TAXON_ID=2916 /ORGANISM="Ceratium fusus, Strain PA161109" /LENGTH=171 /DNA_ID=CAMNT_0013484819 /DNA_START=64 /DNA_END=575 /DNA_ORIENTATION=+